MGRLRHSPDRTGLRKAKASKAPTEWVGGKNTVGWTTISVRAGRPAMSPHHYIITLIATSLEPGQLVPGLTREELLAKLRGKGLAPASIVGKYVRGM